jgi:hypothetical protein
MELTACFSCRDLSDLEHLELHPYSVFLPMKSVSDFNPFVSHYLCRNRSFESVLGSIIDYGDEPPLSMLLGHSSSHFSIPEPFLAYYLSSTHTRD